MKTQTDDRGLPYLLVALDQLPEVKDLLVAHGVAFVEDEGASQSCAGPVVGVLRFPMDADRGKIEALLRAVR